MIVSKIAPYTFLALSRFERSLTQDQNLGFVKSSSKPVMAARVMTLVGVIKPV
jgi:hypothetical protein